MCLLLLSAGCALADEAEDITGQCAVRVPASYKTQPKNLTDHTYTLYWESGKVRDPYVTLTAPAGKQISSLYVCFGYMPETWEIQVSRDGKAWTKASDGDPRFLHAFVSLPESSRYVRLQVSSPVKYSLRINELYAFTEGETPDWVQKWEPTLEKADLLFISTHPDDELLFFGGAIPTYAAERQDCRVVVAYFSHSNSTRSSELLNGLWHVGVRNYPDIGTFRDGKSQGGLAGAYKRVGGEEKVNEWMVGLYRRYRPEVVVTQDVDGEYGHSQHRIVVAAARNCISLAADGEKFPDLTQRYGAWEVKKLYLHLFPENQLRFDWSVPLQSMGGRSGGDLAREAFVNFHNTQPDSLVKYGEEYDNRLFGLAHTTVGPDLKKDDFLENIPLDAK